MKLGDIRAYESLPRAFIMFFPLAIIVVFLLVPVWNLFYQGMEAAFTVRGPLPDYFWPHLFHVTGNTFTLGGITTVISLMVALPLAFLLSRTDLGGYRLLNSMLTVPLITPPFIMAFATLMLYGQSGVFSILLHKAGVDLPRIFGLPGLVLTQLTVSIPYAVFIISAGLKGVPRHIEETAVSMGGSPVRVLFNLVLPCVYPHLIISGLMIFLMSIGDVGGPLILGGGYSVLSTEIYTSFLSLMNDERIALILSLWIILLAFVLLGIVNLLLRLSVKQYRPGINPVVYRLGKWKAPAAAFVYGAVILLLLPFTIILIQSFSTIWTNELTPRGWTLSNYGRIIGTPDIIWNTVILAVTVTPVIIISGLILGHTMHIRKKWKSLNFVMIIPFVLPGVVIAAGVLQAYAGIFTGGHHIPFYFLLVMTVIIRRLPYSLKTLEAGFIVADPRREESARSLGSNQMVSFLRITLPQMKPFLFAAIIIGVIKTSTELSAALILSPPDWRSLSLGIVYFIDQGQLSRASALSVVLVAVIGAGTAAAAFWSQKSRVSREGDTREDLENLVLGKAPIPLPRPIEREKKVRKPFLGFREPLVVIEDRLGIIEANKSFLKLTGASSLEQLQRETSFSVLFFGDRQVLELFSSDGPVENRATAVMVLDGRRVPVILNAYMVTSAEGFRKAYLYCRRVSGRARRIKEYRRLRERMQDAEQTALKAQITPHFLFNSLNSLIQLIDTKPSEAREVVQSLADLYRYILASTKESLVTVEEEIQSVKNYLAVEKARFGPRLNYRFDIASVTLNRRIPPMLLQPVVENAVNHGANELGDIDVKISVRMEGGNILMRVEDKGSSFFDPEDIATGSGTGLKNVEGRLFSLYHRKISFEKGAGGGLAVTIAIPGVSY